MNKNLVAYFSASGMTAKLAKTLSNALDADLYEIKPAKAYTPEDLNWQNPHSRSSVEMADKTGRPAVSGKFENMEDYDTVFVGFPIWWYIAPTVINTFLEQYDFSNKTVVPFATSGGSGMGKTNKYLRGSCKGAVLKEGKVFSPNATPDELSSWVKSMGI